MSAPDSECLTPVQRLQTSRAHIRAVLCEAKSSGDSVLNTLLKPLAAERPLTLAALAALLGGVVAIVKPWRWKSLPYPWMKWASVALTAWAQSRSRND